MALVVVAIAIVVPSLAYLSARVLNSSQTRTTGPTVAGSAVVTLLLTYGTVIVSVGRNKRVKSAATGLFKRGSTVGAAPSGALQLVFVMVTLALLAAAWLLLLGGMAAIATTEYTLPAAFVVLGFVVVLSVFVDQPWLSLHPFYRERLAGAFAHAPCRPERCSCRGRLRLH